MTAREEPLPDIQDSLARMGYSGVSVRGFERLTGGVSGSATYRVTLESEEVILKVTSANASPWVVERARREAEFYRRLADSVPLQVPRVLGINTAPGRGVCLLLARYDTGPLPEAWTSLDYLQVVEALACLHAAFWNQAEQLALYPWLRRRRPADTSTDVRRAHGYWQALGESEHLREFLTPPRWRAIHALLEQIEAIEGALHSLPVTLCHGDCHIGNLLRGQGGVLVWADWQEVGIGCGPEDLSFLLQRASAQGGTFQEAAIVEAYRQHLEVALAEDLPFSTLLAALHASELRTRLLFWPAYLKGAARPVLAGMLDRITDLASRLDIL